MTICIDWSNLIVNTIDMKKQVPILEEVQDYQYFLILLGILLLGILTK